jgi:endonuclease/exonuclease/phosphatase (EEP) superfamily protein YafD
VTALLTVAAALLLLGTVTPLLPPRPRRLIDLPSHFQPQYAAAAVMLMIAAGIAGATAAGLMAVLSALTGLFHLFPFFRPEKREENGATPLKILQANVLKTNRDTAPLLALIAAEKPDIIACAEVTPLFAAALKGLAEQYPHRLLAERDDYGMAVLSRLPLLKAGSVLFTGARTETLFFQVEHGGALVDGVSLHPTTPLADIAGRDAVFDGVAARLVAEAPARLLVMGDFNATPWCPALKKLAKALNLRHARNGRGILPSWPVSLPLAGLRLPIDHLLASRNIVVADFRLGPPIGSDHFPTLTTILVSSH